MSLWRSNVAEKNSRRQKRHPADGPLRVMWEDEAGRERFSLARLMDISVSGARLRLDDRIPVRSPIMCNDPKLGISGRGAVRYCNFVKGKYEIGIHFPGGSGWKEPPEPVAETEEAIEPAAAGSGLP